MKISLELLLGIVLSIAILLSPLIFIATLFIAGRGVHFFLFYHLRVKGAKNISDCPGIAIPPEAITNTQHVAERCQAEIPRGLQVLPQFPTPEGMSTEAYLHHLCQQRLPDLYPDDSGQAQALLEKELHIIHQLGLANYLLVVWDIVKFCQQHHILCHGRGSAANSLTARLMGISAVDPIAQALVIERFVSVEHGGTPDIDLDIDAALRESVIQYVYDRWGRDQAAMACTYVTYRWPSAIRDAGFALGFKPETVEAVAQGLTDHHSNQRGQGEEDEIEAESDLSSGAFASPVSSKLAYRSYRNSEE